MFPGEDERLLRDVVGIGGPQPPQKSAQGLLMHVDQTPEGVGRTGPGARHQSRFGTVLRHRSSLSRGGQPRDMNSSERKLLKARAAKTIIGMNRPPWRCQCPPSS